MPWSLTARRHGLPIAAVPGGGYRRDWQQLIPLHLSLFEEAKNVTAGRSSLRQSLPKPN
jgi:hypothetical protein